MQDKGRASHPEVTSERGSTVTPLSCLSSVGSEQIKGIKAWHQLVKRPLTSRTNRVHSFGISMVAMGMGERSDSKYTLNTNEYESITEI